MCEFIKIERANCKPFHFKNAYNLASQYKYVYRMEQLEFFDLPNPCKGVCESNAQGLCKGCFRKREERQYWQHLTTAQQYWVLRLCRIREIKHLRAQMNETTEPIPDDLQSDLFGD